MEKKQFIAAGFLMLVAWIFCFSIVYAQNTQTIMLQPGPEGKDTYVCDCKPAVNNPNGPITNLYQGQYGTCYDRILIQWDLSSLPKNISVTSATMELKCNTIYGSKSGQMVYYLITGEWEETIVTCGTLPGHSNEDSVVTNWPAVGQWHSVDITKFVQMWMNDTTTNHGIYGHCIGTTGECDCEFSSSDVSTSANRPKLTITYATTTKVEDLNTSQPLKFHLDQNYPNPFNPTTTILFILPYRSFVSLKVFDLLGREVATIVSEELSAGSYTRQWNASDLPSGVFFGRLQAGLYTNTKKLVLLR